MSLTETNLPEEGEELNYSSPCCPAAQESSESKQHYYLVDLLATIFNGTKAVLDTLTTLRAILLLIVIVASFNGNTRTVETIGAGLVGTFVPVPEPPDKRKKLLEE